MAKEIGIFCGTFNPIHWGHLLLAERARDELNLDQVLIITSPSPPHRNNDLFPAELRHRMVSAAVQDNPHFIASRLELDRTGPSYTIDTLQTVQQEYGPEARLNLLLGMDNLPHIASWHKAQEIFQLSRLVVAPRQYQQATTESALSADTIKQQANLPAHTEIAFLNLPFIPVSGSDIRRRLKAGASVLYLVPPAVDKILHEEGLYH